MEGNGWTQRSEWMMESRRKPRWMDRRTAMVLWGRQEELGKTADISLGGMQLQVSPVVPAAGESITVAVVFEDQVIDFQGRVRHAHGGGEGSFFGFQFVRCSQEALRYLAFRYASGPPFQVQSAASPRA